MTTFKKEQFHICAATHDGIVAKAVDGYTFTVPMNGEEIGFGVRKDECGKWNVFDLLTGRLVNQGFRTRTEAVAHVADEPHRTFLESRYENEILTLKARAAVLIDLIAGCVMSRSEYVLAVDEYEKRFREEEEERMAAEMMARSTASVAAETSVVTLADMKAKALEWGEVLVRQKREGACIWVTGALEGHADELKELGFRPGRSKEYGRGYWLKPVEA